MELQDIKENEEYNNTYILKLETAFLVFIKKNSKMDQVIFH